MKRLVKLTLFAAVIGGLVVVARKLMGGLGPQPGTPEAPKEWPSLVPEPPTPETASDNGSASTEPGDTGASVPAPSEHIAPTEDSGSNS